MKFFSGLTLKKILFPSSTILQSPGTSWRDRITALIKHELRAHTSPDRAASSVAFGVFMGLSPFHGFQMAILLPISYYLRLNRPLAILGVNISCAPLIPVIITMEIAIGRMLIPSDLAITSLNSTTERLLANGFAAFLVGSSILSIFGGILAFLLARPLFSHFVNHRRTN